MAWYWATRELAQATPPRLFDIRASQYSDEIFQIYDVFNKELKLTQPDDPVLSEVLQALERQVERLLDDLASKEICELMGTYVAEALPIFKDGFFRADFEVAWIGLIVHEYSRRQAPQNWFVLFYLNHYGKFEYIFHRLENKDIQRGKIAYRGFDAQGQLQDKTFQFDRLIVRQGPDFKSLGYDPALESRENSQFRLTHRRNLEYQLDPPASRYNDQFITAFRTDRWNEAVAAHAEFFDLREEEDSFDSVEHVESKLDDCLLDLMRLGQAEAACKIYRNAKASTHRERRFHALGEFLQMLSAEGRSGPAKRVKKTKKRR